MSTDSVASDAPAKVPVLTILIMTIFMSLVKGLGAVPFFFCKTLTPAWSGFANSVACGVMITASYQLLNEGAPYSVSLVLLGVILGTVAMKASQHWLEQNDEVGFEDLKGADARKAILIVGVMAAHAFGEGSGVGVSFSGERGWAQGTLVTIAIGLHNIPEGLATATVMVARGSSPSKALLWSVLTSFPQVLVAVPSYMFVEFFSALLPLALGFAAGCMIWIVVAEMLPDALEQLEHSKAATAATISAGCLHGLNTVISGLENPNGTLSSPLQADLHVLLPVLLLLLPSIVAPVGAAGAMFGVLSSAPVSLGVSLGIMTWLGAANCTQLLISQPQEQLPVLLLWLAIGAASAVFLGRMLGDSKALAQQSFGGEASNQAWPVATMPPGVQDWEFLEKPSFAKAPPNVRGENHKDFVELDLGFLGAPAGSANGFVHDPKTCQCKGQACPEGAHANGAYYGLATGEYVTTEPFEYASRRFQLKAVSLSFAALTAYSLAFGFTVAKGILANLGNVTPLVLPMALLSLPQGLAFVGLVRAGFAGSLRLLLVVTTVIAVLAHVTAVVSLSQLPVGYSPAETIEYDTAQFVTKINAFVDGMLLTVSLWYLWPAARQTRVRRVQLGLGMGVTAGAAMWLLTTGLCWGTPYCLHSSIS